MSVMGALPGLADAEPAFPDDAVEVGLVIGAWGLKGGIRVKPFSNEPKALFSSRRWFVRPPEAIGPQSRAWWPRRKKSPTARPPKA